MLRNWIEISENHARIIRITLGLLDEALCGFEYWAEGQEKHSVLFHECNNLSPEDRQAILQEIEAARALLIGIRDSLGLNPVVRNADGSIRGSCLALTSDLIELGPKYLKGYGAPSAELVEFLEPGVARLIACIEKILRTVSRMNSVCRPCNEVSSSGTISNEE